MRTSKTFQYVHKNQINNSKSKQTYSFSRGERFPKTRQSQCNKHAYDLSKSMIITSKHEKNVGGKFPKDDRFRQQYEQARKKSLSPAPNSYYQPDFVELSDRQKIGSSFQRQTRFMCQKTENPGPGTYRNQTYNPEKNLSYTMRAKPKKDETHWNRLGPGYYEMKSSINLKGNYFNSRFQNSKCSKMSRSQRFKTNMDDLPSPNAYNVDKMKVSFSYQNPANYSFGTEKREKPVSNATPGPGAYTDFSQFSESSKKLLQKLSYI